MKKIIDKYVPFLIEKMGAGINPILLKLRDEQNKLLAFYFHGLYNSEVQKDLGHVDPQNNLTIAQLERYIEYFLQHNYRFITSDNLSETLPAGQPYLMLTFDDGYYNNHLALEILEKYEVPATFFITTRNVMENRSYWWDIIFKYRMQQGVSLEKIRAEQEGLKRFKIEFINEYIDQHFGRGATIPWSDVDRPFTPAELKQFSESPWVCIGNHTVNHSILTNCDREEVKREFEEANEAILEMTGLQVTSIAFPNGNYNDMILEVASELGFRFVYTTEPKKNPLPVAANGLQCLSRFMAETRAVSDLGSFWRLGYTSDSWYTNFKEKVKAFQPG